MEQSSMKADADQLVVSARNHGIALIGPTLKDNQWRAKTEGAFIIQDFTLDWDRQLATSLRWHSTGAADGTLASSARPDTPAKAGPRTTTRGGQ